MLNIVVIVFTHVLNTQHTIHLLYIYAHRFVARVNEFKTGAKSMEERAAQLREELVQARKGLEEMETATEEDSSEVRHVEFL